MVFELAHFCLYTLPLTKKQKEFGSLAPISLSRGPKPKKHHVFLSTVTRECRCGSCMFTKIRILLKLESKISAVGMQHHCSALLAQPYISKSQRILWCLHLQNLLDLGCLSEFWGILKCGEFIKPLKSSCSVVCSGRGEGSVWPFTSFFHMQCILGVPALLVGLLKPCICFWSISSMFRAEVCEFCAMPAYLKWSSLPTCGGDVIQLGFFVCGEGDHPLGFRNGRCECHAAKARHCSCLQGVCNSLALGCSHTRLSPV